MKKLSYFVSLALAGCMLVSCGGNKGNQAETKVVEEEVVALKLLPLTGEATETVVPAEGTTPEYTLVERPQVAFEELPTGVWISLFDGETLNGWRGYGRDDVPARWIVEDGTIKFNGSGGGEAQGASAVRARHPAPQRALADRRAGDRDAGRGAAALGRV